MLRRALLVVSAFWLLFTTLAKKTEEQDRKLEGTGMSEEEYHRALVGAYAATLAQTFLLLGPLKVAAKLLISKPVRRWLLSNCCRGRLGPWVAAALRVKHRTGPPAAAFPPPTASLADVEVATSERPSPVGRLSSQQRASRSRSRASTHSLSLSPSRTDSALMSAGL